MFCGPDYCSYALCYTPTKSATIVNTFQIELLSWRNEADRIPNIHSVHKGDDTPMAFRTPYLASLRLTY
jgi:hypothetical protein